MKTILTFMFIVFSYGNSSELFFINPTIILGGLDIGSHEINNRRNLSFCVNGGIVGPQNVYFGGQFASNTEWMLPPYWDGKPDPNEYEVEFNCQVGKIFEVKNTYLKALIGVGFAHEVRRGEYIPDSDNKYKEESSNEIGFPYELSIGFLKNLGVGIKFKGWAGRNSYSGFMIEILGKRERNQ